jgi:transcriptional regulator with XRE-family HTH domain
MKTERDKFAEMFADYMIEAMARTRLRQSEIARATGLSRTTISQIVGKKPHSLTGKLLLPERETVDKIAKAFGDPLSVARRAAGYSGGEEDERKPNPNAEREAQAQRMAKMIQNWSSLTPEQQDQLIAISETFKVDHPELVTAPIKIVKLEDITESDVEDDDDEEIE